MQTVSNFSGDTVAAKSRKTNWSDFADGNIYKAVRGQDFDTTKGFIVSMSRWANDNDYRVERFVDETTGTVEFRLTALTETSEATNEG